MFSDISGTAGIRMHGWHHTGDFCRQHLASGEMLHLLAETTNVCDLDCVYCYTVERTLDAPDFHRRSLPGELSLAKRKQLIDQAVALGAVTYDIVGAGEPLIDEHFRAQIEYAVSRGLTPVIFTNGSVLGHPTHGPKFAQHLWELGATVVVKWHSKNHRIHDEIVQRNGAGEKRDRALALLKQIGFNQCTPTRLGIDNIVFEQTISEIPDCLRICRRENIFLVCSTFIPSGRTQKANEREASYGKIVSLYEQCKGIDEREFGIHHAAAMPYVGYGRTCTQYMGLYVTIQGDMFGCVGKTEAYGNIRDRSLASAWEERLPLLKDYDGGCPPRRQFYREQLIDTEEIRRLF